MSEEQIKDACDYCKTEHCIPTNSIDLIRRLEQKLRIATEALEVYADKTNWTYDAFTCQHIFIISCDCWHKAAEAIRKIGEVGK